MSLTEEQLGCVKSDADHLMIVAGPGSGKTQTLTWRIWEQVKSLQISPREITAITFTRKAAQELELRLVLQQARRLVEGGMRDLDEASEEAQKFVSKMHIGTLHSWCLQYLRYHASALALKTNFSVLDEIDVKDIKTHLKELYGEANLEEVYWQFKMGINCLDYDDLLNLTLKILDDEPKLAEMLRISWLYWDEFQDSSEQDYRLLKHMNPAHSTIVGDPDQAIYGFRGSNPEYMDQYFEEFDPELRSLSLNFRSVPSLVSSSQRLIAHNTRQHFVNCKSACNGDAATGLFGVSGNDSLDRYKVAVSLAVRLPKEKTAILVRTNHQLLGMAEECARAGIEVEYLSVDPSFWNKPGGRMLFKCLQFVDNPSFSWALEWLVKEHLFEISDVDWLRLKQAAADRNVPLWSVVREDERFKDLAKLMVDIPFDEAIPVHHDFEAIERALDTRGFWQRQGRTTRSLEALKLARFAEEWGRVQRARHRPDHRRAFLSWSALRDNQEEDSPGQKAVVLSTIHGAKGLEWDHVILVPWEEGAIPNSKAVAAGELEEERRVAYVGITRARKQVFLASGFGKPLSRFDAEIGEDP